MIYNIIFAVMLAVTVLLWVVTKKSAWTFVLAIILQLGTIFKWGLPIWEEISFFLAVFVGIVLLVLKKIVLFKRLSYVMLVAAIVAFLMVAIVPLFNETTEGTTKENTTGEDKTGGTDATKEGTTDTWLMVAGNYENNRWFADGVAEIKDAKTDAEAADAANAWLERVKTDPNLLVAAAKFFLNEDVDKSTLTNNEGYATDEAVALFLRLQLLFAQAKINVADAPGNGWNSGINEQNGSVVTSSGVTGDTKGIQVTTTDGNVFWVLGRCGNVVTPGKPSVPTGKTDNPTPKTPLQSKDPSQDPAPKGNAPTGGGKNVDSGAGTYVAPENMAQPPATAYVAPAAPVAATTAPSGSTPDATPAPAAEPQAPTPEAPATGEVTVPGF